MNQEVKNTLEPQPNALFPLVPELPLPHGVSEIELRGFLKSVLLADAPPQEMVNYCEQDFKRFVYTYGLVRDSKGKCLELGSNPYFTTMLLRQFTQLELTLANYFSPHFEERITQDIKYKDFKSGEDLSVTLESHHFNIEGDLFPFNDAEFDVVLFCEIIEHLLIDPVSVLKEIKRVLKPNGVLVLTTPNVNRLENVTKMIGGFNIYDPYSGYGPYGRHNREYNKHELNLLLNYIGFSTDSIFTADVYHNDSNSHYSAAKLEPFLRKRELDLGQYIFIKALNTRKAREKKPDFLYRSYLGDQVESYQQASDDFLNSQPLMDLSDKSKKTTLDEIGENTLVNVAQRTVNRIGFTIDSDKKFLEEAYREILGRDVDESGLNSFTKYLKAGYSRTSVLIELVKSEEFTNKFSRENSSVVSNKEFLEEAYREILGRDVDESGLTSYLRLLEAGHSRTSVLMDLVKSDEFINNVLRKNSSIQNLRELRPLSYNLVEHLSQEDKILIFQADCDEDFDWLESMIIEHDYYEKPGVWSFNINLDKRVMAEIVSAFRPERALEIGCANGTILKRLYDLNVNCEGVEISRMAISKAFPEIKNNIYQGDILSIQLSGQYDFVFGLDIFEHLNPNKLDNYISKIEQILSDGSYLFANIPVFDADPIFGTVFSIYIKQWEQDSFQGRNFTKIPVDPDGYPIHGHLIWASSLWWVQQFEQHGLRREMEIEKAFHEKYDDYMEKTSIGRKMFYVFSKNADKDSNEAVINRIIPTPSSALKDYYTNPNELGITEIK
ncbi:MAG: DUF4214 domain-containing protein [Chroococcidiopsidaceae cyanobacterium CP_BM_RX_35]|nr:DUF4214 domain-containing protein [Chroococcidiopsidaceae cyanobacterium CP_BM_RX_35]